MKQAIILILLTLFFPISAIAEDRIRCSGKVIASGSTKFELELHIAFAHVRSLRNLIILESD